MALVAILLLKPGCATDPTTMELATYVNQEILGIAELEQKALYHYASVTGENFTSTRAVIESLREHVIPLYGRFHDMLMQIHPRTDEVRRIHRLFLMGSTHLLRGFEDKLIGLESGEDRVVRQANRMIETGREENERWRHELMAALQEHGLREEKP
ncbi:MAG: hypothetical protein K9M82_06305 [Deltaproteobacteria bacterium]|nr:hypothetical protein [Deltaproteobacteria bacterium]